MSKLTGRKSKKDIFYPETGLPGKTDPPTKDGYVMGGDYIKKSTGEKITGESTGKIKVDEKGVKYVEDIDNPSDTTHLKNIGPIQQKYSSMKSMGQASDIVELFKASSSTGAIISIIYLITVIVLIVLGLLQVY